MVWTGDERYRLAPALQQLLLQLQERYPGQQWLSSPQTGTIGDINHLAKGWTNSDHNPWLANTVRALDVAANVEHVAGIVDVADAPDCEALFAMVNRMYAARDPRVWPDGYAIYLRRITNPNDPGGYWPQQGDPHLYHLHISVSRNPAGYNSTANWPVPGAPPSTDWFDMATPAELKAVVADTPVGLNAAMQVEIRRAAARASGPLFVTFSDAPTAIRPAIYAVTDAGLRFIPAKEFGELTARWGGPPYVITSTTASIWWRLPIAAGTFDPRK